MACAPRESSLSIQAMLILNNTYDGVDAARIGVVRDRPEERALVYIRLCKKRGACLIHNQEYLP